MSDLRGSIKGIAPSPNNGTILSITGSKADIQLQNGMVLHSIPLVGANSIVGQSVIVQSRNNDPVAYALQAETISVQQTTAPSGTAPGGGSGSAETNTLDGLSDVQITNKVDQNLIVWDEAQEVYVNKSLSDLGGISDTQAHNITGPLHTASGLIAGNVMMAIAPTVFGFGLLGHNSLGGLGEDNHHAAFVNLADDLSQSPTLPSNNILSVLGGDGLESLVSSSPAGIRLSLRTPGSLSAISQDIAAGSHTHSIGASSSPDGESILKSNAASGLTLKYLDLYSPIDRPGLRVYPPSSFSYPPVEIFNSDQGPQIRLKSSVLGTDLTDIAHYSGAGLYIRTDGDVTIEAAGGSFKPHADLAIDLGEQNQRWRTIYAGEMSVETLVAQGVMATIGGMIMVSPTTMLTRDLSDSDVTIYTKHNPFRDNDYILLKSAPNGIQQTEVMQITEVLGITPLGDYAYTVTRALDGATIKTIAVYSYSKPVTSRGSISYSPIVGSTTSGSAGDTWSAGDAVVSLQYNAGEGYIELTSTNTLHNYTGPLIEMHVRTGTATWDASKPVIAIGNLEDYLDYASKEFGFAVGNDLSLVPSAGSFKGLSIDRTNGIRLFNTAIKLFQSGTNTGWIKENGDFLFGTNIGAPGTTSLLHVATSGSYNGEVLAGGAVLFGDNTTSKPNMVWDSTNGLRIRSGKNDIIKFAASGSATINGDLEIVSPGKIIAGGGETTIEENGLFLNAISPATGYLDDASLNFVKPTDRTVGLGGVRSYYDDSNIDGFAYYGILLESKQVLNKRTYVRVHSASERYNFVEISAGLGGKIGVPSDSVSNFPYVRVLTSGSADSDGTINFAAHTQNFNLKNTSSRIYLNRDTYWAELWFPSLTSDDVALSHGSLRIEKGLYVGQTGTTPGDDNIVADGTVDAGGYFKRDGTTGHIFVSVDPIVLTDTSTNAWNGSLARNTGTYNFDMNDSANGSLSNEVKAVMVRMAWNQSTGSTNYVVARKQGSSNTNYPVGDNSVSSIMNSASGVIELNVSNGQFEVIVGGANATNCYLIVVGYFL